MEIKDLSKYSTAEKIILAEQLWDSISKKDIELSNEIQQELDVRLQLLKEGKTCFETTIASSEEVSLKV